MGGFAAVVRNIPAAEVCQAPAPKSNEGTEWFRPQSDSMAGIQDMSDICFTSGTPEPASAPTRAANRAACVSSIPQQADLECVAAYALERTSAPSPGGDSAAAKSLTVAGVEVKGYPNQVLDAEFGDSLYKSNLKSYVETMQWSSRWRIELTGMFMRQPIRAEAS